MTVQTHIKPGESAEYTRKITERDILGFAAISGDHAPIHVDEAYARTTAYGKRIAHGALMMGLLSTTSSVISARSLARGATYSTVSLGYDKIRIIHPVFIDDTVTARYTVEEVDEEAGRSRSRVEIINQDGKLCLVGSHILKWVAPT